MPEKGAPCCYAKSDKYWVMDPQGIVWETFRSFDTIPLFGDDAINPAGANATPSCCSKESQVSACCGPSQSTSADTVQAGGYCCGPA